MAIRVLADQAAPARVPPPSWCRPGGYARNSTLTLSGSRPAAIAFLSHMGAVGLHSLHATGVGDDRIGPFRGETLALLASRPPGKLAAVLAASGVRSAAPGTEVFSFVVNRVHLLSIGEHRRIAIQHDRVRLPRRPTVSSTRSVNSSARSYRFVMRRLLLAGRNSVPRRRCCWLRNSSQRGPRSGDPAC